MTDKHRTMKVGDIVLAPDGIGRVMEIEGDSAWVDIRQEEGGWAKYVLFSLTPLNSVAIRIEDEEMSKEVQELCFQSGILWTYSGKKLAGHLPKLITIRPNEDGWTMYHGDFDPEIYEIGHWLSSLDELRDFLSLIGEKEEPVDSDGKLSGEFMKVLNETTDKVGRKEPSKQRFGEDSRDSPISGMLSDEEIEEFYMTSEAELMSDQQLMKWARDEMQARIRPMLEEAFKAQRVRSMDTYIEICPQEMYNADIAEAIGNGELIDIDEYLKSKEGK